MRILRVTMLVLVATMVPLAIATEESFYYWAPIAVAVVLTLLEMRNMKRSEGKQEELEQEVRRLQFGWLQLGHDLQLTNAIDAKLFERINERLDALEGTDAVPKEQGEKMTETIGTLKEAYTNMALAFNNHDNRISGLESELPDVAPTARKRGRK